jgi:hypothetical protein
MRNISRAARQLQMYQQYSTMARQAFNDAQHAAYTCMAWDALTQAAKLDPEAAANASAMTISKVH